MRDQTDHAQTALMTGITEQDVNLARQEQTLISAGHIVPTLGRGQA